MGDFNSVTFSGRLVADPEYRVLPDGTEIAKFRLVQSRAVSVAADDGKRDYMNCVAFGQQAIIAREYLDQGAHAGVEGRLQSWSRPGSGQGGTAFMVEIVVSQIKFMESRADKERRQAAQVKRPKRVTREAAQSAQDGMTKEERRLENKRKWAEERRLVEEARRRVKAEEAKGKGAPAKPKRQQGKPPKPPVVEVAPAVDGDEEEDWGPLDTGIVEEPKKPKRKATPRAKTKR